MDKKGTVKRIMSIFLITTVGLIILYTLFFPDQLGAKIVNLTPKVLEYVNITIGEEIEPTKVEIPADIDAVFNNLTRAFEKGITSKNTYCLIPYPAINEKTAFKGYNISLEVAPDGMWIILNGRERGMQELKRTKIMGIGRPCVVGGKAEYEGKKYVAAENFYNNWILKKSKKLYPEYTPWYKFSITGKYELTVGEGTLDLEDNNLKYAGKEVDLLYKANSNHICFFATFDDWDDPLGKCNADEDGLDDDCLEEFLPGGKYPLPFCEKI